MTAGRKQEEGSSELCETHQPYSLIGLDLELLK